MAGPRKVVQHPHSLTSPSCLTRQMAHSEYANGDDNDDDDGVWFVCFVIAEVPRNM